ncbi:MAG: ABC transporter substrate-binding protein, partial [Planctomycetota bacterium]
ESKNLPSEENYFRIPLQTNPPDLDPILLSDTTSDGVASKMFNTLIGYDEDLNLVPELAVKMPEISEDGLEYTFELRRGVKFHNGREVKADDVKFSLTRLAETRSKRFNVIQPIAGAEAAQQAARKNRPLELSGVQVLGDYIVKIRLNKPYVPFIYLMTMTNAAVVPREEVEKKGYRFSRSPVGTGPFQFSEWKENNYLLLTRFDDYFEGKPKLAGIHYRVIPEPLARQEEYKAGKLDIVDFTLGMYEKWTQSDHADEVVLWPQATVQYYGFNLAKKGSPYAGYSEKAKKLRWAVNYAVDREHICQNIYGGRHFPTNGIIPRGIPGNNESRPVFTKDIQKAKRLLAEAGYPDGQGLPEVELFFNRQGDNDKVAQSVQDDLRKVGIPIRLKQLDWGAYIQAADAGEPAFFRLGWVADYPDPENFLYFLFHSNNKGPQGNVTFYDQPEVDRLIDASYEETDRKKRLQLLGEAEERIIQDVPWLFLTVQNEAVLLKPYIQKFRPTPMDDDVACAHVKWHQVEITPAIQR